ncbi:MAG: HD domain-containing protein [Nitrospirae bacterium]|nr:HD domain-containing protein [Nitrospirota bacterium]
MDLINVFISTLMSAVSNCSLYSRDHASVEALSQKAISILNEILEGVECLEIMIVEGDLIANKLPLRDVGVQGINLMKRLKRKGISRIDFLRGITFPEIKQLIAYISDSDENLKTFTHIRTGVIDVKIGGFKIDSSIDINLDNLPSFSSKQVEMVKEVYKGISPFKKLNVAGLEEIVVNFILTFRKEVGILKLISPVKSYSEYTYTHATNVAVLTMFQAESLGMQDSVLRDIGISALLHDVGKLFISKEVLEKKDSLNEEEWEEIKLHPLYGARYLAKLDSLPRLASIVAFEHHLRYDGKGYPKLKVNGKKQHICSQCVAISDYFDALRSRRPYRRELEIKEVIAIMKKEAGGVFNPVLLDNFIRTINIALSE